MSSHKQLEADQDKIGSILTTLISVKAICIIQITGDFLFFTPYDIKRVTLILNYTTTKKNCSSDNLESLKQITPKISYCLIIKIIIS